MYICISIFNHQRGGGTCRPTHSERETPTMQSVEVKIYIYILYSVPTGNIARTHSLHTHKHTLTDDPLNNHDPVNIYVNQ